MAKISLYGVDGTPSLGDKLIGTDVTDNNATKNYVISDILGLLDLSDYVTISTSQTIIGTKTFDDDTVFNSEVSIPNITQAPAETDRILVSDSGVIKYRTASQVLNEQVHFGSFYDTTNQVGGSIKAMTFNSSDLAANNGVSIANGSEIVFPVRGTYNLAFSAEIQKTGGSSENIYIWLRANGVDVPETATLVQMANNTSHLVAAWNFFYYNQTPGDYCEIMWYAATTNVELKAINSGLPVGVPNVPSIILTVNQVG